ncbi:MAG TPA: DUF3465 domain-containing protein [Pyrinomonadaceae bacterium]|nr:DUF3465 domain-containing protein [Pyrinomonadaceae bacterium]
MKQPVKLLLLSLLICLFASGCNAQNTGRRARKPSSVICKIASVPDGMVVVGYKRNSACSDGAELLVKEPENGDIVCAESPVPPEFSIVTEAQGDSTGTCPTKAFLIAPANSGSRSDAIARAFASGTSGVQVEGEGTVIRVLPDDPKPPRHERFIVQLASGQTVLVAHNIDIAPRVNELKAGDTVRFYGEYVWNEKGGVIHWTHHDPQGRHVAGWVMRNGKTYQ